ncbi:MAG: Nif3-like dinuclear metal center hexameric protein, partial [Candidatus Methanofastidiosia archaeon]
PLKKIDAENRKKLEILFEKKQNLYAAHTTLDYAPHGISWALAKKIGIEEDNASTPQLRTGSIKRQKAEEFIKKLKKMLDVTNIKKVGNISYTEKIAAVPGSGFSEETIEECYKRGINTLVSGDLKHHPSIKALELEILLIDAGHMETEMPGLVYLTEVMKKKFPEVEIEVVEPQKPWKIV